MRAAHRNVEEAQPVVELDERLQRRQQQRERRVLREEELGIPGGKRGWRNGVNRTLAELALRETYMQAVLAPIAFTP
jgi:hypothetical protein